MARRRLPGPYPKLSDGRPLRVAFVGQDTYFRACALGLPAGGVEPAFVNFRAGGNAAQMRSEVDSLDPHVVFCFRPEIVPAGCFADLPSLTVGYVTEPLPRGPEDAHPDAVRRLGDLSALDPGNFDRIISFDPLIVDTIAEVADVWRSIPLPVADEHYAPLRPPAWPPRALFVGRSTEHRELFLTPAKHEFDVLHLAHGASGDDLQKLFDQTDICINLHNHDYPSFENRCSIALAAGKLLVTERLSPTHGLEPALDYIEVTVPEQLLQVLANARSWPEAYRRIRVRGRRKAELFRASSVYPRLVRDLLLDIATFGRGRAIVPARRA
jgi:hypothetical protein